jgi:hypothetical protein
MPGHPRHPLDESKTWMRGSSPRMTVVDVLTPADSPFGGPFLRIGLFPYSRYGEDPYLPQKSRQEPEQDSHIEVAKF